MYWSLCVYSSKSRKYVSLNFRILSIRTKENKENWSLPDLVIGKYNLRWTMHDPAVRRDSRRAENRAENRRLSLSLRIFWKVFGHWSSICVYGQCLYKRKINFYQNKDRNKVVKSIGLVNSANVRPC